MHNIMVGTHEYINTVSDSYYGLIVSLTLNLRNLDRPGQDTSEMGTVADLVPPSGVCVTTIRLSP